MTISVSSQVSSTLDEGVASQVSSTFFVCSGHVSQHASSGNLINFGVSTCRQVTSGVSISCDVSAPSI